MKWEYLGADLAAFNATNWDALGAVPNTDENLMLPHLGGDFNSAEVAALRRAPRTPNLIEWFWQPHPSNPRANILCMASVGQGYQAILIYKPEPKRYAIRNSMFWKIRRGG
jgi:hypothetical protein